MASSSRSSGPKNKSYSHRNRCTAKDASSSSNHRPGKEVAELEPEQTMNWLVDLPPDVTILMLQKVGAIDILMNVQKVCVSWHKICRNPALWRSVDMRCRDLKDLSCDVVELTKQAINRSCGQLLDINLEYFGNNEILQYIVNSTNQLKRLRMVMCWDISDEGLSEAVKQLPFLEELHIYFGRITSIGLENVGAGCPGLKSFTYNEQGAMLPDFMFINDDFNCNAGALAISRTMHQLQHLSLFANRMTDEGLQAILDACPHLESLDIRYCFKLDLSGLLGKRCSSIKSLRLPNDFAIDYEFDAPIFKGCDCNSYGDDLDELTDDDDYVNFANFREDGFLIGCKGKLK